MELCSMLIILAAGSVVLLIVCVLNSDADLTLMYADKYGRRLETLRGKVVWITGASKGIGAALAMEAARLGAKVAISARTYEKLEETKKRCIEAGHCQGIKAEDILIIPMDVVKFNAHQECLDRVLDHFGKLDIMIHNAGQSQRARWEHTDIKVDRDLFDLNVFSVVNLTRLILPHFIERSEGTFAVVSSSAGKVGAPFSGSYTGSKHALHGYFESLRSEKLGSGIQITMLCPGPVFSNLLEAAATEKAGENFGTPMASTDKRMTAERCAHLMLVAIAHGIGEAWISLMPVVPLMYAAQYMPTVSKWVLGILGPGFLQKIRDSKETVKSK